MSMNKIIDDQININMLLGKHLQQGIHNQRLNQVTNNGHLYYKSKTSSKGTIRRFNKKDHDNSHDNLAIKPSHIFQQNQAIKILDWISAEDQYMSGKEMNKKETQNNDKQKVRVFTRCQEDFKMQGWIEKKRSEKKKCVTVENEKQKKIFNRIGSRVGTISNKQLSGDDYQFFKSFSKNNFHVHKRSQGKYNFKKQQLNPSKWNQHNTSLPDTNQCNKTDRIHHKNFVISNRLESWKSFCLKKKEKMQYERKKMLTIDPEEVQRANGRGKKRQGWKKEKKYFKNQDAFVSYIFHEKYQTDDVKKIRKNQESEQISDQQEIKQFRKLNKLLRKQEKAFVKYDFDKYRKIKIN